MSEADFYGWWTLGGIAGGLVVAIVAALLTTILVVARRIATLADTALTVAGGIETATRPVWALDQANRQFESLGGVVRSIETRVRELAETVDPGGARSTGDR